MGNVESIRQCAWCNVWETFLWDYEKKAFIWTPGRFYPYEGKVFVFHGSSASFAGAFEVFADIAGVSRDGLELFSMEAPGAWEEISRHRDPVLYLASDWMNGTAHEDWRFRTLVSIGHV
jgi:hypothetical protein